MMLNGRAITPACFHNIAAIGCKNAALRRDCNFGLWLVVVALLGLVPLPPVLAGGGPENVLLIVNGNSDSSKAIANLYIRLRKIPPSNVLYLDWKGELEIDSAVNFHDKILYPTIKALDERQLTQQIDYLVYSSDFPWRLNVSPLMPNEKFTVPFDPYASLTGATYLLPYILGNSPALVMPNSNWYVPGKAGANLGQCTDLANVSTRGFRSRYLWDSEGKRASEVAKGQRYLLCTMLAVTQGRGNTEEEVFSYLRRAAAADGTRPAGSIYFMWNKDIRSATRDKCFASVAAEINRLGVSAKVQQGRLPDGASDVAGMMVGFSDFSLAESKVKILPGAICEHLTSCGGIMTNVKSQTPLSEFLRHGAAGASGTVVEPRAIQAKFPLPSLQLHYARGCSLAEAFYQSISGPYQILVVGDPLCQPWARFPKIRLSGSPSLENVKGTLSLTPTGEAPAGRSIGHYEVFIDGRRVAENSPGKTVGIDTTQLADGYHELRVVGIVGDAIETQGRLIAPLTVRNRDAKLEFQAAPFRVQAQGTVRVTVRQPGAKGIKILQNSRVVGNVEGEGGEVEISAAQLGRGQTSLQAVSEGSAPIASAPLNIEVE
ncbi:MAG: hypothetical protein IT425_06195 [Pirellulales bacterium]|nr:hypothetical protein [Pirellulales bacterium]